MPNKKYFKSIESYYATYFHELIHWTGLAQNLNRITTANKTSSEYAFEELVAELGAAFLSAHFNIFNENIESNTAYIASWIQRLEHNPNTLWKAASHAQQAVDFLLQYKISYSY